MLVETDGREDVQVTVYAIISRGNAANKWTGFLLRGTDATAYNKSLLCRFDGDETGPDLVLIDDASTTLKTWDLSTLLTTAPVKDDAVELVLRCAGDDITFYSMRVNGGAVEVVDDTYTLTGTPATNHGASSAADFYGIWATGFGGLAAANRFEYFKVESIPA